MTIADYEKLVSRTAELHKRVRTTWEAVQATRARLVRTKLSAQLLRSDSAHERIPLDLAVATIFRDVYRDRFQRTPSRGAAHLDGLAYTIAELWPIYVYEGDGSTSRQLTREEVAKGLFRRGAKELHFVDGRAPIRNLAVSARVVKAAVATLRFALEQ